MTRELHDTLPRARSELPHPTLLTQSSEITVLATDLDGTLIPNRGDSAAIDALESIRHYLEDVDGGDTQLLYVTGRNFDSVIRALADESLPTPDWILCDVGTTVYRCVGRENPRVRDRFARETAYDEEIAKRASGMHLEMHREVIGNLDGFRPQESIKQGRFKLSYYVDADSIEQARADVQRYLTQQGLACSVIVSVDPFNGDGLLDVLPSGVSKSFALNWWCLSQNQSQDSVLFCGDSGNDYEAMTSGYRTCVVANADRQLARRVQDVHSQRGWVNRLFLAGRASTAGVLDAMRWFGMMSPANDGSPDKWNHFGAIPIAHQTTVFRVFASDQPKLNVEILSDDGDRIFDYPMTRDQDGFHIAAIEGVGAGGLYRYRCADESFVPDPASRFQPNGVHGPSQVMARQHAWVHDSARRPQEVDELILYEMHIATFTDAGTFAAAIERLDELVDLGITAIEIMPIAGCPGRWNWGYDGVNWYAPMAALGTPEDLRSLVDASHARGMAVIVDVVYNHFGPEGNYLSKLGPYVSDRHGTPWGAAPNFDGAGQAAVRQFIINNAIMWLDEYHVDGLRVDAIHCMKDDSITHITQQLGDEVGKWAETKRRVVWMVAESNVHDAQMTSSVAEGGTGFDAQWNDDFLHGVFATVRPGEQLTTRSYEPQVDLATTLRRGYVFEGDIREFRGRADPSSMREDCKRSSLIHCIQNHDFIGNHPMGLRLHALTSTSTQAAAATLLLMSPSIPMLFMGEEFACDRPFQFFVDFTDEDLRRAVVEGRRREYPQHDWSMGVTPVDVSAMTGSKIGPTEDGDPMMRAYYRSLIESRKDFIKRQLLRDAIMHVDHDPSTSTFRVDYRNAENCLTVIARLGPCDAPTVPIQLTEVLGGPLPAHQWHDSRSELGDGVDPGLHLNHAIVAATLAPRCGSLR
ncbi:MAG: malto-oligosyltrehalose trehalohydrolase [Planctomycetota bacterium]